MVSTMELYTLGRDPRAGTGAAPRLDLSQSDQGLDLEALGEGADAGGPGRRCASACPASPPRSCRSSGSRRCGSTTRWSAPRLARICKLAGVELIAWTVDDLPRMREAGRRRRRRHLLQRPAPLRRSDRRRGRGAQISAVPDRDQSRATRRRGRGRPRPGRGRRRLRHGRAGSRAPAAGKYSPIDPGQQFGQAARGRRRRRSRR